MRERFAEIVERHQRAVYAVAFAVTRDRALADDVAQETFLVAWRRLDELRDPERLAAWLCGIARNVARDAMKRRRRETIGEAGDIVDPSTPFDALSDAQAERVVANALATVPHAYREPLVMFYVEQRSIEDVARALGLSTHTTNKRLSRGRARLAAQVDALVERRLTLRGPRPELVAGVLAAIALGSASHVDASPAAAKGSIMPKLVLPAVVLATAVTVGGATLLSAGNRGAPTPRPVRATTPSSPSSADASRTASSSTPPSVAPTSSAPTPHAAPRPPQLPAKAPAPDCTAVAQHLSALTFDRAPHAKQFSAEQRAKFIELKSRSTAERCVTEKWSADRRICAMAATDGDDAFACRADAIGTADEIAALPPELSCDALGARIGELALAPGGKFAVLIAGLAGKGETLDVDALAAQVHEQMRARCEALPWSATVRRCVLASKTHDDATQCW